MRKITLMLLAVCMAALPLRAIVAHPEAQTVIQPDGSTLTLRLLGDEFVHRYETADGYTVLRDPARGWVYATRGASGLQATDVIAHDAHWRSAGERMLLNALPQHLADDAERSAGLRRRMRRDEAIGHAPVIDYARFRGLIILINYEDRTFGRDDAHDFYDSMVNQDNYTGYRDGDVWVDCPGSVRDYYRDNSDGIFCPEFDIVGPVTVPYSSRYPMSTANSDDVFASALSQVDDLVDFSHYDADGDGVVDMVFFLVAGYSANFTGNDEGYLWPHMYYLDEPPRDGMRFGRYACSTELYGWEAQGSTTPMGISVICHEFTHVMGFPDLYDTDAAGSGGESHHPGDWDVMASGTFFNFGRTPVAYSIFERYAFGFATPQTITETGDYSLPYVGTTNRGLILRTDNDGEFFIMENRQQVKWDAYLPGHGMIVARVDSTDTLPWLRHRVNVDPSHNYYELLRAGGSVAGAQDSDPFPGASGVTRIDNVTTANLLTWDMKLHRWAVDGISERDGVVSFKVVDSAPARQLVEDFETMPMTEDINCKNVEGRFARWDFIRAHVVAGGGQGAQSMSVSCPGAVTTAHPIDDAPFLVSCRVNNPTRNAVKVTFSYSINEKQSWRTTQPEYVVVPAQTESTANFRLYGVGQPAYYRISQTAGTMTDNIFIDDITFTYLVPATRLTGDVNGDGNTDVADINVLINIMLGKDDADRYAGRADLTHDGSIDVADINAVINAMLGR